MQSQNSINMICRVEVIIGFYTVSSIQRRCEAITNTLKQIEGECVAVISNRMKSVKIYFDKSTIRTTDLLMRCKIPVKHATLRGGKKIIILKQSDGAIYLGDTYCHQTIERYLENLAHRNLRRVALLKYNDRKDGIVEGDGMFDQVYRLDKTEYQRKRRLSYYKRKNQICKICPNKHVGYNKHWCGRTVMVVNDVIYSQPVIRSLNVVEGRGASSTAFSPVRSEHNIAFTNFETRLATFRCWKSHPDPRNLAANGFFYKGDGDTTTCFSCGVVLKHWEKDDDPLLEHIRYSPTCKHLENTVGWRTIQEYLGGVESDPNINVGFNGVGLALDGGGSGLTTRLQNSSYESIEDNHTEKAVSVKSAKSPGYDSFAVRISTFAKFPNHNGICIRDLAEAGFYYTDWNDEVRCFWCNLGLKAWEFGDDPYKEHARYFPGCEYLKRVKGEDFIRQIQIETHLLKRRSPSECPKELIPGTKTESKTKNLHEDVQKRDSVAQGQISDKEKEFTDILTLPAAQSVIEHGYTEDLVLAAVRQLNIRDETKLTAMSILDVIFSAEENGLDLTEKNIKSKSHEYKSDNVLSPNEEFQQLLSENQKLKSMMLCKYCQEREKNILLLPCAHRSLCHECANKNRLCPDCWKPIKDRVRTYMA